MPRVSTYFETPSNAVIWHLVIGHSQVRHVWDHNPDNNISIDWISVSGGHSHELAQMIKNEINESAIPLYISGLICQNDVTTLTIASACAIIQDLEQFMMDYPHCKPSSSRGDVRAATLYSLGFLSELNTHLRNYNARQGYSRYPLSKVETRDCPGGQMKIRHSFWQEYIQGTGYGYHLTNNGKRILGKFIRRFHFDGFTGNHVGQTSLMMILCANQ